jgi:hypothetical protein
MVSPHRYEPMKNDMKNKTKNPQSVFKHVADGVTA